MNATGTLTAQHRAIERLFDDVSHGTRRRTRATGVARLTEELVAHLAAEEAVFYPVARRVLGADDAAGERGRQHQLSLRLELRRLLGTRVSDAAFPERLDALRELFLLHVHDEEGDLFTRVGARLSEVEHEAVGAEILAARPPVWIVTTERASEPESSGWARRSTVRLPAAPSR